MIPSSTRRRIRSIKRSAGTFWRSFRRTKKGIGGLASAVIFVSIAVAAPLISPYDPARDFFVGGDRAMPEWVAIIFNPPHSFNTFPVRDPDFSSAQSLSEWTIRSNSQPIVDVKNEYVADSQEFADSKGIARIISKAPSASVPPSIVLEKKMSFQQSSGYKRFLIDLRLLNPTTNRDTIKLSFAITDPSGTRFELWTGRVEPGKVLETQIDSFLPDVKAKVGKVLGDPTGLRIEAAKDIFAKRGEYVFELAGAAGTGLDMLEMQVDRIMIRLLGSAFGVLGTDAFGRDILSQFLWGSRISIFIGVMVAVIGVFFGLIVGVASGFIGGVFDEVNMRTADLVLVLPGLPLLLVLIAVLGASIWNLILLLGFLGWAGFAKIVRSQTLSLRERAFVEAARAAGAGTWHIIAKHIVPNVVGLTYVVLALSVPGYVATEATLSFLGLGDPRYISYGKMLFEASRNNAITEWWWVMPPGLGIAFIALSFVMIGYAMDEVLNPRLRGR